LVQTKRGDELANDKVVVLPLLEDAADMEQSINECIANEYMAAVPCELMAILAPTNAEYLILSFSIAMDDEDED
jgi:hypothetical protein